MSNTIFLFGPSCSGKSTLGQALQKELGGEWIYVDRDDLIKDNICTHSTADRALDERIQSLRGKIIVDAQIPWREKQKGECYFVILPPLEILLKRDAERTIKMQRSQQQAFYAREYVVETHSVLSKMKRRDFDHCFDSSRDSIEEEVNRIRAVIKYNSHSQINCLCLSLLAFIFSVFCSILIKVNKVFNLENKNESNLALY